jgi:hypothetical protein
MDRVSELLHEAHLELGEEADHVKRSVCMSAAPRWSWRMSEWGTTTRVRSLVTLANGEVYRRDSPDRLGAPSCGTRNPARDAQPPRGFFPVTQESGTVFVPKTRSPW